MQTLPTSAPATALPLDGVPPWIHALVGFLLLGVGASLLTTQLRAALPPNVTDSAARRILHQIYPSLFGAVFAVLVPDALPGFPLETRAFLGSLAPTLWRAVYNVYKSKAEKQLGVTLPSAVDILGAERAPTTAPTPEA